MSRPNIPGFPINQNTSVTQTDYRTPETEPLIWAHGRQRPVVSEGEQRSILAAAGMVGAGVFAAGAIPLPGQKGVAYAQKARIWDKYIGAAKFAERASPAQILSTFRISEALSPLERVASGKTTWGGQFWDDPSRQKYLGKLLGKDVFTKHKDDILSRGLVLSEGKLRIGVDVSKGQGLGATVLGRATKLRTHRELGQAEFFKNYVRAIGADDLKFSTKEFLPIGGRNIAHAYARYGYTSVSEMTNRILRVSPTEIAELPVMRDLADKIKSKVGPKVQGSLAAKAFNKVFPEIKAGAAHQTIGRYLTRRVLPAVALWKGFQLADYATGNMISGTVLGGYAQAKVMKAKLMEATGMQEYATRQEEIAPGSTSLLGLAAFPLKGAMLGFGAYGARLAYTAREAMRPGVGAAEAALIAANKFKEKNYNTFFGIGKKLGFKQRNLSSALRRTGGLLGLAFAAPFFPGAISGTETSEELEAIYSGEKEVAIRKGRWWEAGRSPYEGGRIQYFRKHFIPSYLSRGKVKALYGTEGQKILSDPIYNPIGYLMDPYKWEKEHYYEFPFPVTAPAFEDVPFIGPMLAATIGQVIKPSKLMHTEEWMRQVGPSFGPAGFGPGIAEPGQMSIPVGQMRGELEGYGYGPGQMEVKRLPRPFGETSAFDLGEIPRGIPVDPYSPTQAFGEQAYRLTEMFGLPGYSLTVAKGMLTGTEEFYDQYERLESASRATGIERAYWDLQIGGGALSTELFRRLYPHRRRGIDLFNPIKNTMPGWLPGPGQPSPDFQHGFAFGKILEGELRLPGRGMEALYPELEGIDPKNYSLMWRYKILSDVSPYSPQTKFYKQMVQGLRKQGVMSERDEQLYETIQDQLQQKKIFKEFREQKQFIDRETETRTVTISKMIEPGKFEIEEMPGVTISMAGLKTSQSAFARMAIKENNELTQQEAGVRANQRRMRASRELAGLGVAAGTQVEIEITGDVLRQYAKTKSDKPEIRAVVRTGEGVNLNRMLLEAELAEYDKASAGQLVGQVAYNPFEQLVGAYWETGIRAIDDPSEYLTPFSPFHKFLGTKTRTAVEEYAAAEAYGTSAAFWDRPWENFLRPMLHYAGYKYAGMRELPQHIKERNEIEGYFDKLKYLKFTRLKNMALTQGDTETAEEYEKARRRTAFGADPYGNPLNGLLAMQKRDKPYFDAFARASTESERELIMDMLPKHERHLVQARWNLDMMNQLFAERKIKGSLSTEQHEMLEELHKRRISEGQAVDPSAMAAYKGYANDISEETATSYADFQRERLLADYFKSHPLPRNDFVGWCLPKHGEVLTESGVKRADEMAVGDLVLQSNGYNKILKVFTREISEEIYLIKSVAGSYKQECTENHKLLIAKPSKCVYKRVIADYKDKTISNDRCVPRSNKQCRTCKKSPDINAEWTAAENISVNDYVVFGKPVYSDDPKNIDLLDYFDVDDPKIKFDDEHIWLYFADKRNKINRFVSSDYRLGYLVGLYMAEGHLGRTAAKTVSDVRLTHHLDEVEYANKFCQYIKDVFGIDTVRIYERHRDTGDALNTQVNSTLLAMLFDRLCGQHCDKKRVKESALFNNEFNVGFLAGSLFGDGGKTEKKRIRFVVTSKEFAMQVRRVAMSIGFLPSITHRIQDTYKDTWLVEFLSHSTEDFYVYLDGNDRCGLINLAKNTHTSDKFLIDNSLFYRIKDISVQKYSGTVYDFNVENIHEYECFGGTYHNSPMTDLEDIKLVVVKNEGRDMHDFNLWESREKTLPYKPYIDEDAIEQVTHMEGDMSAGDMRAALHDILASYGVENVNITVDKFLKKDPQNIIDLDITRDSLQVGFENAVKEGWI